MLLYAESLAVHATMMWSEGDLKAGGLVLGEGVSSVSSRKQKREDECRKERMLEGTRNIG